MMDPGLLPGYMLTKLVRPLIIQPTKYTIHVSWGLSGQMFGQYLVYCPLPTKMDNSMLAILWIPPSCSHTLWISSPNQFL